MWAANAHRLSGKDMQAKSAATVGVLFLLRTVEPSGCAINARGPGRKRVYMYFMRRKGWLCQFVEEDLKTPLPKSLIVADEKKVWEMAKRGGFSLNIAGRQELEEEIRKGSGGIWLELTAEQYAKLREPKYRQWQAGNNRTVLETAQKGAEFCVDRFEFSP